MIGYGDAAQRYFEVRDELTEDPLEIAFQVLRLAHGRAAFCKPRGTVAITTGELARQMGVGREPPRGIIARAAARPGLRKTRRAAPVDRVPNEFRGEPLPDVSDSGEVLARDLVAGAVA
jgi:hypothetical protein